MQEYCLTVVDVMSLTYFNFDYVESFNNSLANI